MYVHRPVKRVSVGLTALLLLFNVPLLLARHSFAMFDRDKVVNLKGVVREFQWTNPHCWVQLTVKNGQGAVEEWSFEALSPNVIGRMGWKRNTLKPGDEITAYFNPTRDGSHGGNLVKVALADGTIVGGGQ